MSAEAVFEATRAAVARARAGEGPSFLECRTYRFEGHHTIERRFRLTYRTPAEVEQWRSRDPLLLGAALLPDDESLRIDAEVAAELARACEFALGCAAPDPADALAYLYADTSAFVAAGVLAAEAAAS
jgi:pyruvate dehydrogenase E1 component alpha subunit